MNLVWRLYHEDHRITLLTIEELTGSYLELPEELALEFHNGIKRFSDYVVYDNKLMEKPKETSGVIMMPVEAYSNGGTVHFTLELDPSWLADNSINSTSKYELKWLQ